ncbi:hypothetical protein D9757_004215 [Collybiopsis confluens]|uniref:Uncharacterized protein n=1 Tax=Collybiopsis confluens TaxID=2823264 RepID=A0A8H5MD85_9AGAR|nr:hypothetical protein D9757_004215 [Collybiopsis confluens]
MNELCYEKPGPSRQSYLSPLLMLRPSLNLNTVLRSSSIRLQPSSALRISRQCQIHAARSFHRSPPSHSFVQRLAHWAWYKKDGYTPRSKKRGLLITTGVLLNVLLLSSVISALSETEDVLLDLAAFIQIQQIDSSSYSLPESEPSIQQRNWDDWNESASYFKSIAEPILLVDNRLDPEDVDHFFHELGVLVIALDDVSGSDGTESLKTKIHTIMNSTSHAVHQALLSLKSDFQNRDIFLASRTMKASLLPFTESESMDLTILRASEVVLLVRKGLTAVLRVLQERRDGEIEKNLGNRFKVKGDDSGNTGGSKEKGYDIIG